MVMHKQEETNYSCEKRLHMNHRETVNYVEKHISHSFQDLIVTTWNWYNNRAHSF